MSMNTTKTRRLAVVGGRAVGKSSLTVQFVEGHFTQDYYPTIETTHTKTVRCNGQDFSCEIIDTAGQDEYSILPSNHAIGIHGYALVFDIRSRQSFELLKAVNDKILNVTGTSSVPMVLVGNKSDLEAQRQVTVAEAQQLARDWHCVYIESSAKLNQNTGAVFELLLGQIEKAAAGANLDGARGNGGTSDGKKAGCVVM